MVSGQNKLAPGFQTNLFSSVKKKRDVCYAIFLHLFAYFEWAKKQLKWTFVFNGFVNLWPLIVFGCFLLEYLVVYFFGFIEEWRDVGHWELGLGGCWSMPGMWPGLPDNEPRSITAKLLQQIPWLVCQELCCS